MSANYTLLKQSGNNGEAFFMDRHNELLTHPVILLTDMRGDEWSVEGSDIGCERLLLKRTAKEFYRPQLQYGGVEVKSIGSDKVLPRTGVDGKLVIGYPLWAGEDGNGRPTRTKHGNLKRWLYPSVKTRSSKPMVIVHLLETEYIDRSDYKLKRRYFASIAYEDIDTFLSRLVEYAASFGMDLTNWDTIPVGNAAKGFEVRDLYFQGNMWLVPLSAIGDLATVTLIGDEPDIRSMRGCPIDIRQARLDELKCLAADRWIAQEKPDAGVQSDEELFDIWHNKLLMGYPFFKDQLNAIGTPLA